MKQIPLKTLDDISYRELITQVVRVPLDRQQGATIDEMRRGIRILDALDRAEDGALELEDADWEHLRDKVRHFPWGMVDRRLLEFCDDVEGNGLAS